MLSKERVLRAIDHKSTDRIPLDFWSIPDKEFNIKVMKYFGVNNDDELLERLHIDLRWVETDYRGPSFEPQEGGTERDCWGAEYRYVRHSTGVYKESVYFPLAQVKSVKEIEDYHWPDPSWYDYSVIPAQCAKYASYAICGGNMYGPFRNAWLLRGLESMLMDMALQPVLVDALLDRISTFQTAYIENVLAAGQGKIDILLLFDDLGTQVGPIMSPKMWRRFLKTPLQKLIDIGKKHGCKILLHSCGSVRAFIPDFIEMGVDVLNPIQVQAAGMDPAQLKRDFGKDISFHGSLDIQGTLPHGTVGDVKREVQERIESMGEGGGFILAPTHRIQSDTPPENIAALFDWAVEISR